MDRSLVNGAVKGRMSIMLTANFVILRSNVIMLERHKWYSTVQKKHIEAMKHILGQKQSKLLFSSAQGKVLLHPLQKLLL